MNIQREKEREEGGGTKEGKRSRRKGKALFFLFLAQGDSAALVFSFQADLQAETIYKVSPAHTHTQRQNKKVFIDG